MASETPIKYEVAYVAEPNKQESQEKKPSPQIRIFNDPSQDVVEHELNAFLATLEVDELIDIKLFLEEDMFRVMVIYKIYLPF